LSNFAEIVAKSLPAVLQLPEEFVALFEWMGSVGAVADIRGRPIGMLDPRQFRRQRGYCLYFHEAEPDAVRAWTGSDNEVELARLASIVRTGGDGSMAAIWLDDDGVQRIVHMGSGSGSVMNQTLAPSALDFLRLLAIGYEEICWPEDFDRLPIQVSNDRTQYAPPTLFRTWLASTYDVTIPATASELLRSFPMYGNPMQDRFCLWLDRICR
jgi:hypothetical protein